MLTATRRTKNPNRTRHFLDTQTYTNKDTHTYMYDGKAIVLQPHASHLLNNGRQ